MLHVGVTLRLNYDDIALLNKQRLISNKASALPGIYIH